MTWAGATGTPSCGSALTPGSLTSAQYTQTFAYDTLDRLTSGPLGSYTYGDSAHKHAATSIGSSSYTTSYDANGDMICRAPTGSQTCSGTPTGQLLTYDNEGRTTAWQNAQSSPTSTENMAYDGERNRVALKVNGGTPTYYLGDLEEIAGGTLTKYFSADGLPTSMRVGTGGTLCYLADDGLGSVSEALDGSGNATFQQLFTPYGAGRYSSGTSPTTKAFTGQRADSASGLDYYVARYYDPVAGQFVSADPAGDGLDRYAYVKGNPETLTDPTGLITFGICVNASAGAIFGGFVAGCVVGGWSPDSGWSGGLTGTAGGGAYVGAGAGVGVGPQFSTANTVDDLGGTFGYAGGGVGTPILKVGAGGDGFIGSDSKGRPVVGIGGGPQVGVGRPAYGNGGLSTTGTLDFSTIGNWIGQHAPDVGNWIGQRASDVGNWVSQRASDAGNWIWDQYEKLTGWLNDQIRHLLPGGGDQGNRISALQYGHTHSWRSSRAARRAWARLRQVREARLMRMW